MELSDAAVEWLTTFIRNVDSKFNRDSEREFEVYSSSSVVLYYDKEKREVIPFEKNYISEMGKQIKDLLTVRGVILSENNKLILRCYEALNGEHL